MNLPILHKHYPDILAGITSDHTFDEPTMFIRGAQSKHMQDEDDVLIKELFPEAFVETIPDAGHWVHADRPAELLTLVKNFIG